MSNLILKSISPRCWSLCYRGKSILTVFDLLEFHNSVTHNNGRLPKKIKNIFWKSSHPNVGASIPRLSEVPRSQDGDDNTQSVVRRRGGNDGSNNRSVSGKNKGNKKEDPIEQFCKEFNSPSGCNTVPCNKRHNSSRRLRGGIFCNQKTHRRATHDDQYWFNHVLS